MQTSGYRKWFEQNKAETEDDPETQFSFVNRNSA